MNKFIIFIALSFFSFKCNAAIKDGNKFLNISNKCSAFFEQYERKFDLPVNLLSSVSITESGRRHPHLNLVIPWPYSVNHSGKPYYFDSKSDAIDFVSKLIKQGFRNIDVGCMQVNLKHHPQAFDNLHEAFDPDSNIAYAAKLIKKNYINNSSWVKAIAHYHSGERQRGIDYASKVIKLWKKQTAKAQPIEILETSTAASKNKSYKTPSRNPLRISNEISTSLYKKSK
jgi:hypothetical protein